MGNMGKDSNGKKGTKRKSLKERISALKAKVEKSFNSKKNDREFKSHFFNGNYGNGSISGSHKGHSFLEKMDGALARRRSACDS